VVGCRRAVPISIANGSKPMTDITQALCLVLLVICLGACLILAFWELESARQRRRERNQFVRDARRTVMPVTKRGASGELNSVAATGPDPNASVAMQARTSMAFVEFRRSDFQVTALRSIAGPTPKNQVTLQWQARRVRTSPSHFPWEGYLPSFSIFFLSSSFISLTFGSWLDAPVV
jgi:hypothetical protein